MKIRISSSAKAWLLGAATIFALEPPLSVQAQTDTIGSEASATQSTQSDAPAVGDASEPGTKSAVMQHLDRLYSERGMQAPNMTPAAAVQQFSEDGSSSQHGTAVRRPAPTAGATGTKSGLGVTGLLNKMLPGDTKSSAQPSNAASATHSPNTYFARPSQSVAASGAGASSSGQPVAGNAGSGFKPSSFGNSVARRPYQRQDAASQPGPTAGVQASPQTPEGHAVHPVAAIGEFLKKSFPFGAKSNEHSAQQPRRFATPSSARSLNAAQPTESVQPSAGTKPAPPRTLAELLRNSARKMSPEGSVAVSPSAESAQSAETSASPLPAATSEQPIAQAEERAMEQPVTGSEDPSREQSAELPGKPSAEKRSVATLADEGTTNAASANGEAFANPFVAGTESQADGQPSPYSGRTLDPDAPAAQPATAPAMPKFAPTIEDAAEVKTAVAQETEPQKPEIRPAQSVQSAADRAETAATARRKKMERIAERDGAGLKGFCSVALRDERELKDSQPEFSATYDSKTYRFSSAEAKAAFEQNPEMYAPVEHGADVVLLKKSDKRQDGLLDNAVWYKDRLYLFTSRETLREFFSDPKRFTAGDETPDDQN